MAWDLEQASDYLTNEVRLFVETGHEQNLQNYFWEAKVNQRRDHALETLREDFSEDSQVYRFLNSAMNESLDLMRREYLAMRLKLEAMGKDISLYPQEIQDVELGEEIPLSARIMAVADVFDALVSYRVYKPSISPEQALETIYSESGTHFDPEIIRVVKGIEKELIAAAKEPIEG